MRLAVFPQRRWGAESNHVLEGKFKATPTSNLQLATNNVQLATHSTAPLHEIILLTRFLRNLGDKLF